MNRDYKIGDVVLGNWTLVKLLGEGAYGKVYEAHREEYKKTYFAAIKIITIPADQSEVKNARTEGMDEDSIVSYFDSFVESMVNEFALMSELKGTANIVSYEDHSVIRHENDIGWDIMIRMELLTPMLDYMSNHKMTRSDVIKLGIDMCKALELCQQYNIIHRDIKPENIFISRMGDYKLGDFGVARTLEKTTGGLSKKGTYTYMAPEVYKDEKYGSTVDTYSLGIVLYRLLNNNRAPFLPDPPRPISYSDRERALERRISGEPLPPPANAEGRLAEIVLKACAYDPIERYSSPLQMRQELEALQYVKENDELIYGKKGQIVVDQKQYTGNNGLSKDEKMEEETLKEEEIGKKSADFEIREELKNESEENTVVDAMQPSEDEEQQTLGVMTFLRERYQNEIDDQNREEQQKKQKEMLRKQEKEETKKRPEEERVRKEESSSKEKQVRPENLTSTKNKKPLIIGIAAIIIVLIGVLLFNKIQNSAGAPMSVLIDPQFTYCDDSVLTADWQNERLLTITKISDTTISVDLQCPRGTAEYEDKGALWSLMLAFDYDGFTIDSTAMIACVDLPNNVNIWHSTGTYSQATESTSTMISQNGRHYLFELEVTNHPALSWEKLTDATVMLRDKKGERNVDIDIHWDRTGVAFGDLEADNELENLDDRKKIDIMVVHGDGKKTYYTFKTDSENLRGALEEKQLIEGESSEYGLFVRTVDGETADEAKQQWWNITKGGKPIETGIDNVVIADGDSYELTLITGW